MLQAKAMTDITARKPAIWNKEKLPQVQRVLAIASGKGGVGKSSVTVNLAHALAAHGLRVGILDADIYGPSIPRMLGLETRLKPEYVDGAMIPPIAYGIKAMSIALLMGDQAAVMRAPMITKALAQLLRGTRWGTDAEPLDYLLIDLPPGTGDVHLSLAQSVPIDAAIIVTMPQDISVIDAEKSAVMFEKLHIPIFGIIENMSHLNGQKIFGEGGGEKLAKQFNVPLIAQLPLDPALRAAADAGQNFIGENSQSEAAQAFAALAAKLSK
jgi:ATP-binding protein involved in chromosome partitioning